MGIFDIFEDAVDFFKDSVGKCKEFAFDAELAIGDALSEVKNKVDSTIYAVNDIRDTIDEGMDEIVHCLDDNYVTPAEKKRMAESTISKSKEKLKKTQESYKGKLDHAKQQIEENRKTKIRLLDLSCIQFKQLPEIKVKPNILSAPEFTGNFEYEFSRVLGIAGHWLRDSVAEEYLSRAKDYSVKVAAICAEINSAKVTLDKICCQIEEEQKLYWVLETEIERKNGQQKYEIATILKKLLLDTMFDEKGDIRERYMEEYQKLARLK